MDSELFNFAALLQRENAPAVLLLALCVIVALMSIVCLALLASVRSQLRQANTRLDALHADLGQTNRLLDKLTRDLDEYTGAAGAASVPSDPFDEMAKRLDRLS